MSTIEAGAVAQRIAGIGDPTSEDGRGAQNDMLESAEKLEKGNVEHVVRTGKAALAESATNSEERKKLTRTIRKPDVRSAKAWKRYGLGQRYVVWNVGRWRYPIYVFAASLDAYIFAKAYGYGVDAPLGFEGIVAWGVGAGIGILVFFVGFVLARILKTRVMCGAQRRLVKDYGNRQLVVNQAPLAAPEGSHSKVHGTTPLMPGRVGWILPWNRRRNLHLLELLWPDRSYGVCGCST